MDSAAPWTFLAERYWPRWVYLSDRRAYQLLTAFALMTYYTDGFQSVPYLLVEGPPGSGKSQGLGRGMKGIAMNAVLTTGLTMAQVYLLADASKGGAKVLVIDEGDLDASSHGDIVHLLNAGYSRGYVVSRQYNGEQVTMDPFGPKIILRNSKMRLGALARRCIRLCLDKAPNEWFREEPLAPEWLAPILIGRRAEVKAQYQAIMRDTRLTHSERDIWGPLLAVAKTFSTEDALWPLIEAARRERERDEAVGWQAMSDYLLTQHNGENHTARDLADLLRARFRDSMTLSEDQLGRKASVTFPSRVLNGRSIYLLKRWDDLSWLNRRVWKGTTT